jgi:ABC-2 type transport system ATP-binding protein
MTTIEATGLVRRFHRTAAVDGATLNITAGVTGLLGPNGAGKTTTLRILATVLARDSGSLRMLGRDPSNPADRLEIRRRLGYLPQDPGYQRGFTVFEFVDYIAILKEWTVRRARHDEVRRVLDMVGLSDVRDTKIRKLSGGMHRRVGLAQALIGDPELLILDEPTVGFDPQQRLRFRDMISQAGEGRTVLLSTHLTDDVAAICGRIVVIATGRTVFTGTPSEVAATAAGRVWSSADRDPAADIAWRTEDGRFRNLGTAPDGAHLLTPTLDDGYMLLVGTPGADEVAA